MLATVLGWLTIYIALILFSMYYFISVRTRTGDIINYLFTYELSTLSFKRKKVVSPMAMYHLYGIYNVIHVALTCVWNKLTKYYKILRWKLCLAISFHIDGDIDCSHVTMPNLCSFETFSNNLTNLHIIRWHKHVIQGHYRHSCSEDWVSQRYWIQRGLIGPPPWLRNFAQDHCTLYH